MFVFLFWAVYLMLVDSFLNISKTIFLWLFIFNYLFIKIVLIPDSIFFFRK